MTCLICQERLVLGSYRLVAIQRDGEAWLSRYACRGACTEQALGREQGRRLITVEEEPTALALPAPEPTP